MNTFIFIDESGEPGFQNTSPTTHFVLVLLIFDSSQDLKDCENKLIELAERLGEVAQIQRLGFVLEKIDVMEDEEKKQKIIDRLLEYLKDSGRPFVSLVPYISKTGHPRCKKWKIIENTDFESDL